MAGMTFAHDTMPTPADLRPLLQALEAAMRAADLWQPQPPTAEALASPLPFMVDTLRIEQWLQWVFLPRLHALLDAQAPLPGACSVHPLAEHEWSQRCPGAASQAVLTALLAIDAHLSQPASAGC